MMNAAESRARELCRKTHGNDSLWEMYLDDARRENPSIRGPTAQQGVIPDTWVMPFGQYKGMLLRDIPEGYLVWLHGQADIDDDLRTAVEAVLEL